MDKLHYVRLSQKGENDKIQEILKILYELKEKITFIMKEQETSSNK